MKTSWYKYLCLLLMTICCLQAHAYKIYGRNDAVHILRVGLVGGGAFNIIPSDCAMTATIGGGGALAFDYAFYKSFDKVDLGLRTGLDLGYMYLPYHAEFAQQYSNMDYLGNQVDYTTSGVVDVVQNQLYASLPLMFALRTHGFVCNIGVRLQMPFYQTGKQQLSNPLVQAYYPKYDVTVTNELITGIVTDEQLSMPLASFPVFLECYASAEIGYEHRLNAKGAIGCAAYVHAGVWNALPKATDKPVIQVAPITDKVKPVPAVIVNDAYTSLLTSYTPLQFGVKVYYAFSL